MTAAAPAPPPLDDGLDQLLRRMRLPHMRRIAPEVIATAKAQRWDPAEVLRALLTEEVAGRDRSSLATRRKAGPRSPPGRRSTPGTSGCPRSRPRPRPRCGPWNGSAAARTSSSAGRPAPARRSCSKPSARPPSQPGKNVAWFTLEQLGALVRRHRADDSVTKAIARILRADLVVVDDIGLLPVAPDAAEGLYRIVDAAYERRSVAVSSQPSPVGLRRAHAQNPGHRHRRPAHAPRPRLPDQRRQHPPHPGHRRKGSDPAELTSRARLVAIPGQIRWPPAGTSHDRHRALPGVP